MSPQRTSTSCAWTFFIPREYHSPMPALLLGATLISFAGVFVKLVDAGPTAAAFYRMLFGGLVLAAYVLARGERVRPRGKPLAFMALAAALFAADLFFFHR